MIRECICADLEYLGVSLHLTFSGKSAPLLSKGGSCVAERVIHTNEEIILAQSVCRLLV